MSADYDEMTETAETLGIKKKKPSSTEKLSRYINLLINSKREEEATEELSNEIKKRHKIYTTRNDDKDEMWIYIDGVYHPNGRSYVKEFVRLVLGQKCTATRASKVITKIEYDTYISEQEFFKNNIIEEIPVQNGILNLKTRKLLPFTADKIFFSKLPVEFDPSKKCDMIDKFFTDVLASSDDKKVMYELFGYCLWKDGFLEQAMMFNGDGSNGKSKTLMLLKKFLGEESCLSLSISQLISSNFDLSEMFGKLANIAGDLSSITIKDTGTLKALTGRDPITTSRKFKSSLTFTSFAKQIFGCNDLPVVHDTTDGFWRRWVLLDFPYRFKTKEEIASATPEKKKYMKLKDVNIVQKIATDDELSGLLNAALDGLDRIRANGKFSYTKGTADVKNTWIRRSNSFEAFCMDCLKSSDDGVISKKDIRSIFAKYCKKHSVNGTNDANIKRVLESKFGTTSLTPFSPNNFTREYAWSGIAWKDSDSKLIKLAKSKETSKKDKLIQSKKLAFGEEKDINLIDGSEDEE